MISMTDCSCENNIKCIKLLCRYENAFSLKSEDRYSFAASRTDNWETVDNTVEDMPSAAKDTSSDK